MVGDYGLPSVFTVKYSTNFIFIILITISRFRIAIIAIKFKQLYTFDCDVLFVVTFGVIQTQNVFSNKNSICSEFSIYSNS